MRGCRVEIAFLFPGQGAKRVDAALRSTVRSEGGRALCELAAREADVPLARLLERPALLDRTEVLQPVLTAICLAASEALRAGGVVPAVVLGHSLGELAAWSAAGCVTAQEAVRLAAARGRLMAREAAARPGGMVALATADATVIAEALDVGRNAGRSAGPNVGWNAGAMVVAAYNAPDETVLTGDEVAVRAVLAFAPALATRVPTAGAWHSPAMAGAVEDWRYVLRSAERSGARCGYVSNAHGEVVKGGDEILELLAEQLVRPVWWTRALASVSARGGAVVTMGPGAVLRSLWHRNQRVARESAGATAALFATDDERSLAETVAALRAVS